MKELKFKNPVSETQLKQIIVKSLDELDLHGRWYFKKGYEYTGKLNNSSDQVTIGHINEGAEIIASFEVYMTIDTFQNPMFAGVKFKPSFGDKSAFDINIGRIYEAFQNNYKTIKQAVKTKIPKE